MLRKYRLMFNTVKKIFLTRYLSFCKPSLKCKVSHFDNFEHYQYPSFYVKIKKDHSCIRECIFEIHGTVSLYCFLTLLSKRLKMHKILCKNIFVLFQANTLWKNGDFEGARRKAKISRNLTIASVVLGTIGLAFIFASRVYLILQKHSDNQSEIDQSGVWQILNTMGTRCASFALL